MANPEHIALLREYSDARETEQDTAAIQSRIANACMLCEKRGERFDISGTDLTGFDLTHVQLSYVNAEGISGDISLKNTEFKDTTITLAARKDGKPNYLDLQSAYLVNTTITGEKGEDEVADGIMMRRAFLTNCTLTGTLNVFAKESHLEKMTLRGALGTLNFDGAELSDCTIDNSPETEDFQRPAFGGTGTGSSTFYGAKFHNTEVRGEHEGSSLSLRDIEVTADKEFAGHAFNGNFKGCSLSGKFSGVKVKGDFSPLPSEKTDHRIFRDITAENSNFNLTCHDPIGLETRSEGEETFSRNSFKSCDISITGSNVNFTPHHFDTAVINLSGQNILIESCRFGKVSLSISEVDGVFSLQNSTLSPDTHITGNKFDTFEVGGLRQSDEENPAVFRGNSANVVTIYGGPTELHPDQPFPPTEPQEGITGAGEAGNLAELGEQVREADNPERTPD